MDDLTPNTPANATFDNFRPDGYGAAVHDVFVDGVIVGTHVSGRWALGGTLWVEPTFHPANPCDTGHLGRTYRAEGKTWDDAYHAGMAYALARGVDQDDTVTLVQAASNAGNGWLGDEV